MQRFGVMGVAQAPDARSGVLKMRHVRPRHVCVKTEGARSPSATDGP
jgi:hypothetical protein